MKVLQSTGNEETKGSAGDEGVRMRKWYSLIDKVYSMNNLEAAFKKVYSNKGAPGIDGETVEEFKDQKDRRLNEIQSELKTGTYEPSPVRRVEIDKEDGGTRLLGLPTTKDKTIQQALKQVIEPIFDKDFHPSSYGYRPGMSCQKAVAKAAMFLRKGLKHAVDMDLSKCFDRLDHELIIESIAEKISDGKILRLIRQFLEAGVIEDGAYSDTDIGSPQGGVISPLICNIYLDKFDQKMRDKGIRIVRYADDILIFAKSRRQAERHKETAITILEDELKLVVNQEKTHITSLSKGVPFLGVIIRKDYVSIHPKRIKRFKDKVRKLTPRNTGINLEQMIKKLNKFLRGWINYFRMANCQSFLNDMMGWIRRRLRMKKMREWKSWKGLHRALRQQGYKGGFDKISMFRWRNSASPLLSMALPNHWFITRGLINHLSITVGVLHLYSDSYTK